MILFGNFDSFDLYTLSLLLTKIITKNDTNVTSFFRMKGRGNERKKKGKLKKKEKRKKQKQEQKEREREPLELGNSESLGCSTRTELKDEDEYH